MLSLLKNAEPSEESQTDIHRLFEYWNSLDSIEIPVGATYRDGTIGVTRDAVGLKRYARHRLRTTFARSGAGMDIGAPRRHFHIRGSNTKGSGRPMRIRRNSG